MHRTLAAWLMVRPWRAAVVSALCGALSPQMMVPFAIAAGAIPVLAVRRGDLRNAFSAALAAALAAAFVLLSVVEPSAWLFAAVGLLFFGPLLLSRLLRDGSMNLAFQSAVLSAGVLLVVVHIVLEDPIGLWAPVLHQVLDAMSQAGIRIDQDQDEIVAMWARTMWGALAGLALATTFGAVLLGRWWDSLLSAPGQFGREYRDLRLGTALGIVATVLFVLAAFTESSLAASLAWVAFTALAFQGLAAAHRLKANGRLNGGWLAALYVALIVPLSMSITVFILAIWGFADNWFRPRSQHVA